MRVAPIPGVPTILGRLLPAVRRAVPAAVKLPHAAAPPLRIQRPHGRGGGWIILRGAAGCSEVLEFAAEHGRLALPRRLAGGGGGTLLGHPLPGMIDILHRQSKNKMWS